MGVPQDSQPNVASTNDLPQVILVAVISATILFTGIAVLNPLAEQEQGGQRHATVLLDDTGEYVRIGDTGGVDETVYNSRGYAVNLTGANDSYVESTKEIDIAANDTWTVSVWARLDTDAPNEERVALTADALVIVHNASASEWRVWYYDDGDRDSYALNGSSPSQPGNFTNVMVVANGTHLTLYRNNTHLDTADLNTSSMVDAPVNATNWNGRIEEVRTFDDALNNSQRQDHVDSPIAPMPGTNRTARIMFDEPAQDTQLIFFTSASLQTSNVTYSQGLPGEVLEGKNTWNDLVGTTDYVWDTDEPRIAPVDGGQLDGAPVAYVNYTEKTATDSFTADVIESIQLAGVAIIVSVLGYIVVVFRGTNTR